MGHGITDTDQVFSVRKQMWHHLGEVLPEYPTREEVQELVHPWEPVAEPLFRRVIKLEGEDFVEYYEEYQDTVLNVRSDNAEPLGAVSSTYTPVTNSTMYDIAEVIEGLDKGSVLYETGGSLFGGKKVWLLLRLAEPVVIKGDPNGATLNYLALQNSHDGSGSFRSQALNTRIVCANTAMAADMEAALSGAEFTFAHTLNVQERIDGAKKALAGWRESVKEYKLLCEYLVDIPVDRAQQRQFIEKFVPMPTLSTTTERVRRNVEETRGMVRAILNGPTCETIAGSVYGLVQAAVEFQNHERKAASMETRFKRAYLDRSQVTADALRIAKEVAGV